MTNTTVTTTETWRVCEPCAPEPLMACPPRSDADFTGVDRKRPAAVTAPSELGAERRLMITVIILVRMVFSPQTRAVGPGGVRVHPGVAVPVAGAVMSGGGREAGGGLSRDVLIYRICA
ncbi:hypothetical protein GCM10009642_46980 [Nocardiopsis metallicus]